MLLNIKYRFTNYPNVFLTHNGEMWQEPFITNNYHYGFRIVKPKIHQGQEKYLIKNRWVSKKKLNECAYLVNEEIGNGQLPEKEMPFLIKK